MSLLPGRQCRTRGEKGGTTKEITTGERLERMTHGIKQNACSRRAFAADALVLWRQ